MKKIIHVFSLALLSLGNYAIAMEIESTTRLLVIPGQNGMGGQNIDIVLPYFANNNLIHHVETPLHMPDFGQDKCQSFVDEMIHTLDYHKDKKYIIHASSQGTATALNYTAKHPQYIKALILESVMLTGNSAIFHTVDNMMMPEGYDLPESSYYTAPYTAKAMFPSYAPTGEQPIDNIDKLPADLPIIILHDTKDFQLSFKDAQALYAYLTAIKNNKNVYLFAQESERGKHINLLQENNEEEISAINTILRLHRLLPHNITDIAELDDSNMTYLDITVKAAELLSQKMQSLKKYQPEVQQEWLDHFEAMRNKEQILECLESSTKITSTGFGLYAFGKWLGLI
jgi:alpha/beta hydrolase fold